MAGHIDITKLSRDIYEQVRDWQRSRRKTHPRNMQGMYWTEQDLRRFINQKLEESSDATRIEHYLWKFI